MEKMFVVVGRDTGENVWGNEDGSPTTFSSAEEARESLREHIASMREAVSLGHMSDCDSEDDFEVVEVLHPMERWHEA